MTTTHQSALEAHATAAEKAETAATLLAAAQRDFAELQAASDAALDDLGRAAELAEAQARVGHLIETHQALLEAAQRRKRAAAFEVLPFIAQEYRRQEAEARKALLAHDAKTEELLTALCEHTETEAWRKAPQARSTGRTKQALQVDVRRHGRAARLLELVAEGHEKELTEALEAPKQYALSQLLGQQYLDVDPWARHSRATLPPELQAGGLYPLT